MISCVIRTLNEGNFISRLIETLNAQKNIDNNLEIIVVDNDSTDATVEIVKSYKAKLIQIKKEEFNYSYALNLGIEHCTGDFIVLLSGHAVPLENTWLEKMISHLEDDSVAGVYCKQIPWPDADPYESLRLEKMFDGKSKEYNIRNLDANFHFSNAACCIRRSVWLRHPFMIMPAAEDREWAHWAIKHNYKIFYDSTAAAYHSHNESCRKAAQRIIQIEKSADLKNCRRRNPLLTFKQSAGWFFRDLKKIPSLRESNFKKIKIAKDCAARSFWYAYDFERMK